MTAMQIEEMQQKNAKLQELIQEKQNLSRVEKEVEQEEELSRGLLSGSGQRSEQARTDNDAEV